VANAVLAHPTEATMPALVVSAGEQVSLRFPAWCAGTGVPSIVDVQLLVSAKI
jgi:hypothetical protein